MIGVWRRIGLPMSLFSVKLSLNSFWPIFGVPSAPTNGRPMPPKLKPPPPPNPPPPRRVERAHHRRQEARRRPRLEDRGVAARLDRARLLALERLVRGDFGELRDVDLRQILGAGDARPARAAAARHAAGEDEAGFRVLVVGEQPFGVGEAGRLIGLRDVAGAEDAFLLADVDRLLHPRGALAGAEVGRRRQRRRRPARSPAALSRAAAGSGCRAPSAPRPAPRRPSPSATRRRTRASTRCPASAPCAHG